MTATLTIESLMLHPRYPEIATYLRALAPTGLLDQADRAATDARAILNTSTKYVGAEQRTATPAEIPGWLRLNIIDAFVSYASGTASTCRHNPDPLHPQPVIAAAWKPGVITCGQCTHLLAVPRDSAANRTCDGCGHICAGPDAGDGIYPSMVQLGPLIFQYGTCGDCRPPSQPTTTRHPSSTA